MCDTVTSSLKKSIALHLELPESDKKRWSEGRKALVTWNIKIFTAIRFDGHLARKPSCQTLRLGCLWIYKSIFACCQNSVVGFVVYAFVCATARRVFQFR